MTEELNEFKLTVDIEMSESMYQEEFNLSDCNSDTTIEQLFQYVLNWLNAYILEQIPLGADKYNIGEHNE